MHAPSTKSTSPVRLSPPVPQTGQGPRHRGRRWRQILAVLGLGGLLVALVVSDGAHAVLLGVIERTEPIIMDYPVLGAAVFVLLCAGSAMINFFSSVVFVPVALDAWGAGVTALLLWLGWTVGGVGAYGVGRYLGRPVVRRLASEESVERYERLITAHAPFGIVLLFLFVLQSEVTGYVLGLARYSLKTFILAIALTEIPFAILTVYVGTSLLERRLALLLGFVAGAALLMAIGIRVLHKRLTPEPDSSSMRTES